MAPRVVTHPRGPTQEEVLLSERSIHPETRAGQSPSANPFVAAPHACQSGWVTIGQMVVDPETGEETEEHALYLCRRCAEKREK